MARGACNCGEIAFEIDGAIEGIYVCHCSVCRRSSGSHGVAVVVVDNEAFRWLRGEEHIASWRKPGADWENGFCRVCGSRVPGRNDESRMFVPAGSITEGGDSLRVIHHIWVDSKADWDVIGDDGKQHPEAFTE